MKWYYTTVDKRWSLFQIQHYSNLESFLRDFKRSNCTNTRKMLHLRELLLLCFFPICVVGSHFPDRQNVAVYSKLDTFAINNSTMPMFDFEGVSRIRCGDICLGEICCKGFMYDENSQRCVGVHFGDFDYTAKLNITFSFIDGMLPYQKGILSIFISHLCFRSRSLSRARARTQDPFLS